MKTTVKVIALSLVTASVLVAGGKNTIPAESETLPVSDACWQIALKGGSLGVGVDLAHAINDQFTVRFNANGLKYSGYKKTIEGIDTSTDLTLLTAGALLDYHPMTDSGFRVSAGAYYNGNKVTTSADVTKAITINGTVYAAGTTLAGTLAFNKLAPYVGIGYSNMSESGWGLTWDLGVMYHGAPKYSATSSNPAAAADVNKYVNDINAKIAKYKVYPVAMVGFRYNF
jgi:hypothetical protein